MMPTTTVSTLLLALPLLACLSSTEGGQESLLGRSSPEAVDPALRAAVDEILPQIEALRGLKFLEPVGLSVASVEDLRAYMKLQIEESLPAGQLEALDTVVKMMGWLPAELDLLAVQNELIESQVGGFYDPVTNTFSLMESLVGSGIAKVILAHELTHALDDQHFDLDGGMQAREGNADALWAYQSVIEGCASAVGNRWAIDRIRKGDGGLTMEDLESAGEMGADVLERTPAFLWKSLLGAYLRGAAFLVQSDSVLKGAMSMPPVEDLNRAFNDPPRSSEQVLHPGSYWIEGERDQPLPVELLVDELPEGAQLLMQDTFGEMQLNFLVESPKNRAPLKGQMGLLGASYSCEAVKGWGGDRWALIGSGSARVLLLRTLWDSEKDAEEFAGALEDEAVSEHLMKALKQLSTERGSEADVVFHHLRTGTEVHLTLAVGAGAERAMEIAAALLPK